MTAARSKIRERILRLRERTLARGCTEAEAIAAAEKAAQLMRDHGLSEADIVMEERRAERAGARKSIKAQLWPIIAACTNTVPMVRIVGTRSFVSFIGREPGPDIACYLREICDRAIDRAVREFKRSKFYRRRRGLTSQRAAVSGFVQAMVNRLGDRLWDVFGPQHDEDAVDQALAARTERYGEGVPSIPREGSLRHSEARWLGWNAGGAVNLAHGVGGGDAPLQIGAPS